MNSGKTFIKKSYNFLVLLACFVMDIHAAYDEINIIFFCGSNLTQFEIFSLTSVDQISTHEAFNESLKTALYIHGYRENVTSESVETVVKAFLKRKSHNVLVLNWSAYANGNYVTNAVPNLIKVKYKDLKMFSLKLSLQIGKLIGRSMFALISERVIEVSKLHSEKFFFKF